MEIDSREYIFRPVFLYYDSEGKRRRLNSYLKVKSFHKTEVFCDSSGLQAIKRWMDPSISTNPIRIPSVVAYNK